MVERLPSKVKQVKIALYKFQQVLSMCKEKEKFLKCGTPSSLLSMVDNL